MTTPASQNATPAAFDLNGHFLNPMVTAAKPLLGLGLRLRTLEAVGDVPALYRNVRADLDRTLARLQQHAYEPAHVLAYSYALCLYLDETVMGTPWGKQSAWSQHSLLSELHHETWGGEKFFTLLAQMMLEPKRYQDGLEFMYLCLCIGLKGKYALDPRGEDTRNALIRQLHGLLRPLRPDPPPPR